MFKNFAKSQEIDFDFIILKENQFNSGFAKEAFGDIKIEFNGLKNLKYFKEVTNTLKADKSQREKFFYLFYRRKEGPEHKRIDIKKLAAELGKFAMQEIIERN